MTRRKLTIVSSLAIVLFCDPVQLAGRQEPSAVKRPMHIGRIVRLQPELDLLLDSATPIEVLATGFTWSEGPAWNRRGGYLLFSDVPRNRIYRWDSKNGISVLLNKSGYDGSDFTGGQLGSNGLAYDTDGRLVVCDHGNRRLYRLENSGKKTTLADRHNGARFNSPNDLVIKSNGDIYFTDPPYGLRSESSREIEFNGVYRLSTSGRVNLLTKKLNRPNGIAFSPDEKTLYVAQSDSKSAIWMAFPVNAKGTLEEGKTLLDVTSWVGKAPGLPDGMAVDRAGNLWATGPGGVWVISPEGQPLGRILTGRATANCAFGGDGSTLYVTASGILCRIKTKTKGLGFE